MCHVSITHVHKHLIIRTLFIHHFKDKKTEAPGTKCFSQGQRACGWESEELGKWGVIPSGVVLREYAFTYSIKLPFQLLLNVRYFNLLKPLNDSLIHAVIGRINGRRRMKGDSFLPQSPFPEEPLLYLMLQDSPGSPLPYFLLLEALLCYFCIPATWVLCMSLFGSLSYL